MCMKCGCSTPNDKKSGPQSFPVAGGKGTTKIVPATDTKPGGYDYK